MLVTDVAMRQRQFLPFQNDVKGDNKEEKYVGNRPARDEGYIA